jgi:hypothetical protein
MPVEGLKLHAPAAGAGIQESCGELQARCGEPKATRRRAARKRDEKAHRVKRLGRMARRATSPRRKSIID